MKKTPRTKKAKVAVAKYAWRNGGTTKRGIDATVAVAELTALREEQGNIEPRDIVNRARPEEAPLHGWFTWDDVKAAERHRRWEARLLCRSIVVMPVGATEYQNALYNMGPLPAADTNEEGTERTYEFATTIVEDPEKYARAHGVLLEKLSAVKRALEELEMLAHQSAQPDKVALLDVARRALTTVQDAIRKVA